MHSMDMPPRRPLDDDHELAEAARSRPGVPDGRARSPSELFDNLRVRLSELAANHPSALREAGRPDPAGRDGPAWQDAPSGTEQGDRGEARGAPGAEDTRQGEPGDAGRAGPLDDAIMPARIARNAFAGAADARALAMMDFAEGMDPSEAYTPWFMSGEQAVPWWAAGDDLWG